MGGWVGRSDTHRCCEGPRWVSLRSTHPTELASEKIYRQQVSQRILANRHRLFDDPEPPRALARIFEELASAPINEPDHA